jgi:hypothetical protein
MSAYVYQQYFGVHKSSKNYKHHDKCGLCGNEIFIQYGKDRVKEHIQTFHPEKMILLETEEGINDEYTRLLDEQDRLTFDMFQLQVIESSFNGSYNGRKHPRYNAIAMYDNMNVLKYKLSKIKERILSYDLNNNSFVPIMSYENLDGLN